MLRICTALLALAFAAGPASAVTWETRLAPKPRMGNKGNILLGRIAPGMANNNIAVVFAGWDVEEALVKAWAESLAPRLARLRVGLMYVVPGPADSKYLVREIQTDELAKSIATNAERLDASFILFAGHSSGAMVAEVTLAALERVAPARLPDTFYYRLDGAGSITPTLTGKLAGAHCVVAMCGRIPSVNGGGCGGSFKRVTINTPNQCKASRCCHLALINTQPQNLSTWDKKDYAGAPSHPSTGWIDQTEALLKKKAGIP
jgi:hypothetical protein